MTAARQGARAVAAMTPDAREQAFWRGVVRALMMVVELIRWYKLGER